MKTFFKTNLILVLSSSLADAAPLTNLVGNWHLDEERGQLLLDTSYYKRHGRLGSTTAIDSNDPAWTTRRFDTSALKFDGVDDYGFVSNAAHLEPSQFSVEVWVNSTEHQFDYLVSKSALSCHAAAYSLESQPVDFGTGGWEFFVAKGDGVTVARSPATDGAIVGDGKWHHLVGTFDQQTVRLYLDGKQVGTGTPAPFKIDYAAFPHKDLYFGDYDGRLACPHNYNFSGKLDEVRIWRKALTPAEVAVRYRGD